MNEKIAAPKNAMTKIFTIIGFLIILSTLLACISGIVKERESFRNAYRGIRAFCKII